MDCGPSAVRPPQQCAGIVASILIFLAITAIGLRDDQAYRQAHDLLEKHRRTSREEGRSSLA